ncbi:interleukin-6 [Etheostoma spectabile]|uniref:interleukin-6 n=1 Tax=Etheostoma spectabile TaxID=54343 RepID=UPI0013AFB45C|nr:interleukin-6-like [Etheostoma spectabile]
MPSSLNAFLLSAVMLCALLLCAPGAPVEDAPTDNPAGDPSGEEEEVSPDLVSNSPVWDSILGATKRHKEEFENEFKKDEVKYIFLEHYKFPSHPALCPHFNFSKEACLHRMVHGLLVYTVLLKFVEKENPGNSICSEVRYYSGLLINLIKGKMRNRDQVPALSSSQEARLLRDLDNPDHFHRKMTAHNILRQLHYFLIDGKRAITKKENRRLAFRTVTPITLNVGNMSIQK